jgi:hypothetical protein
VRRARALDALLALGLAALAGACGTSSNGVEAPAPAPVPPAACAGASSVALTVKNYLSRCAVSVEGLAPSTAVAQTVCVPPRPVPLSASARAGFRLGPAPWHDTDGDSGAGDPGTFSGAGQATASATTVTPSGTSGCAWVCCALGDGTGCPATDQCP